jgi:hypothetical protein
VIQYIYFTTHASLTLPLNNSSSQKSYASLKLTLLPLSSHQLLLYHTHPSHFPSSTPHPLSSISTLPHTFLALLLAPTSSRQSQLLYHPHLSHFLYQHFIPTVRSTLQHTTLTEKGRVYLAYDLDTRRETIVIYGPDIWRERSTYLAYSSDIWREELPREEEREGLDPQLDREDEAAGGHQAAPPAYPPVLDHFPSISFPVKMFQWNLKGTVYPD